MSDSVALKMERTRQKAIRAILRIQNGTSIAMASLQEDISEASIRKYMKELRIVNPNRVIRKTRIFGKLACQK
jgi:hypothetical protein